METKSRLPKKRAELDTALELQVLPAALAGDQLPHARRKRLQVKAIKVEKRELDTACSRPSVKSTTMVVIAFGLRHHGARLGRELAHEFAQRRRNVRQRQAGGNDGNSFCQRRAKMVRKPSPQQSLRLALGHEGDAIAQDNTTLRDKAGWRFRPWHRCAKRSRSNNIGSLVRRRERWRGRSAEAGGGKGSPSGRGRQRRPTSVEETKFAVQEPRSQAARSATGEAQEKMCHDIALRCRHCGILRRGRFLAARRARSQSICLQEQEPGPSQIFDVGNV